MIVPSFIKLRGIRPETVLAMVLVDQLYRDISVQCVITSVNSGKHMKGSLHYEGLAFDIRIKNVPDEILSGLVTEIRNCLPSDFDVVLEKDHLHVEFDPKF